MRFIPSLAALCLLAACAATTTPTATTVARPLPSAPEESRIAQMLRTAGGAQAPTQSEVERLLGTPDIVRQDGAGAALTYRLENCALLLLFAADTRNAMRLAEAHPSARRGGAAPSLDECAREADGR